MPQRALSQSAEALRRAFDASFAEPARIARPEVERFIAVRIGGDRYAIRLAEIGGLYANRDIVPLPSPLPSLMGITVFRGQVSPVHDLAALIGYAAGGASRWLVSTTDAAFAFEALEGHWVVPRDDVLAETDARPARLHVHGVVRGEGMERPIVHLSSVLDDIRQRVASIRTSTEE